MSGLAFSMSHTSQSFPYIQLGHNLFFCQTVSFTCLIHLYSCAHSQHYTNLSSTQLQLNETVHMFGHFFINTLVILLEWGGGVLTALFGLKLEKFECYHLRHECVRLPRVFVPATTTQLKTATYSEIWAG